MANIKSAIKRARQNVKLRKHNAAQRSALRTVIKSVLKPIANGEKQQATSAFANARSAIDKAVAKKLIHKRKGARYKSRLSAHIKAIS
ncbi:MAG: 30S ribosomal protein S20 [Gammaproteobacteria bacterium]